MGKLVSPEVYLVGYTTLDRQGLMDYLNASGNIDFAGSVNTALSSGLHTGEIICSAFAKLCYASMTLGKNDNVTRVRDIPDNLRSCFDNGHGSVFEHCSINFIIRNVSRVFTHELVRHRVGTAFSQTSGRYVRGDNVDIVFDPILEPVRTDVERIQATIEEHYRELVSKMGLDKMTDFDQKKKITSALRRILPNGQSNEIAFSVNIRELRHMVMVRTSRSAEWEIRVVFNLIYNLVKEKFLLMFHGAKEELVDGLLEITGMKLQPYEK